MMIRNQPTIYPPSKAIRTALDVYGENVRKIVPIDSPAFGHVMAVCVDARLLVESILQSKKGSTSSTARSSDTLYSVCTPKLTA
jgi:hypothetical protein